jgi:KDO2-lipid IV(A) lauroyltransferase
LKHKPYRNVLYYLLRVVTFIIQCLPRTWGLHLAKLFGFIVFWLVPKHRKTTLKHLETAYGDTKTPGELQQIAQRVFENLAMTLVDVIYLPLLNRNRLMALVNAPNPELDPILKVVRSGRGVLVMTGHIGNWELMAGFYAIQNYEGAAVARRLRFEKYDELLLRARASVGVTTIYRDESIKKMLSVFKRCGILGMLADQDLDQVEGIFIPFLGKEAYTTTAPARLAMAANVPIIPAFMIREGMRYRLHIEPPIEPDSTRDKNEEAERLTRAWSSVVEQYISRFPDQWAWMHPRWRTTRQMKEKELKAAAC